MTAWDAIRWIDDKLHNVYSLEDKLTWLGQVEQMAGQLRQRCMGQPGSVAVEQETVLSIPAPYDRLYLYWLEAQIDYTNQEYMKYNNAMALFSGLWQEYANAVRREAGGVGRRRFF